MLFFYAKLMYLNKVHNQQLFSCLFLILIFATLPTFKYLGHM